MSLIFSRIVSAIREAYTARAVKFCAISVLSLCVAGGAYAQSPAITLTVPAMPDSADIDTFQFQNEVTVKYGEPFPVYVNVASATTDPVSITLDGLSVDGLPQTITFQHLGVNFDSVGGSYFQTELYVGSIPAQSNPGTGTFRYCVSGAASICSAAVTVTYSEPAEPTRDFNDEPWSYTTSDPFVSFADQGCSTDVPYTATTTYTLMNDHAFASMIQTGPFAGETFEGIADGNTYILGYRSVSDARLFGTFIDVSRADYSPEQNQSSGQGAWWWRQDGGSGFCWGSYRVVSQPLVEDEGEPACRFIVDASAIVVQEGESETLDVRADCSADGSVTVYASNENGFTETIATQTLANDGSIELVITPIDNIIYTGSPKDETLTLSAAGYDDLVVEITILEDEVLRIADVSVATLESTSSASVATLEHSSTYRVSAELEGFPSGSSANLVARVVSLDNDEIITLEATPIPSSTDSATEIDVRIPELTNYYLELHVTANTGVLATGVAETRSFTAVYPITAETLTDSDEDGIPDRYDDPAAGSTEIDSVSVNSGRIVLGEYARRQAAVTESVYQVSVETTVLDAIGISLPPGYDNEGIYDFVIFLNQGQINAWVAIQLPAPLTSNKEWLKYQNGEWAEFSADSGDTYYSVSQTRCTPPMTVPNPIPEAGLAAGHNCVILRLSDGGPNDADGEINGIIVDPSGPGQMESQMESPETAAQTGGSSSGGGGSTDIWSLLLLASLLLITRLFRSSMRSRG